MQTWIKVMAGFLAGLLVASLSMSEWNTATVDVPTSTATPSDAVLVAATTAQSASSAPEEPTSSPAKPSSQTEVAASPSPVPSTSTGSTSSSGSGSGSAAAVPPSPSPAAVPPSPSPPPPPPPPPSPSPAAASPDAPKKTPTTPATTSSTTSFDSQGASADLRLSVIERAHQLSHVEALQRLRSSRPLTGPVFSVDAPSDAKWSAAQQFDIDGFQATVGHNLCVDSAGNVVVHLSGDAAQTASTRLPDAGHHFIVSSDPIPSGAARLSGTYVVVPDPAVEHAEHSSDVATLLWHAFVHPGRIPLLDGGVDKALFVGSAGASDADIRGLMLGPFHTPGGGATVPIVSGDDVKGLMKDGVVCVEKAVIPGGGTHGQLFSSPADARAFREYAFNALSVPAPKPPSGRRARVYIMQRGTAGLATLDRIRNFLRTDKEMKAIVDVDWAASATPAYGQLSGVPLADRLKILRQTDILIGPYGADMTAAAFMESRSSVVEIIHPRLVSSGLASAVESAGQIYHLVPGEPVKGNADCDSVNTKCPSGFLAPDKADGKLSSDCVHALHACPLSYTNTDLFSAEMLILVQKVTSSKWISVPAKP